MRLCDDCAGDGLIRMSHAMCKLLINSSILTPQMALVHVHRYMPIFYESFCPLSKAGRKNSQPNWKWKDRKWYPNRSTDCKNKSTTLFFPIFICLGVSNSYYMIKWFHSMADDRLEVCAAATAMRYNFVRLIANSIVKETPLPLCFFLFAFCVSKSLHSCVAR